MAGDWIPISVDLPGKPEVARLAMAMATSIDEIIGLLVRFWSWAQAQTEDGHFNNLSLKEIALLAHLPEQFLQEMVKVGWLGCDESGVAIPAFERWFSGAAKRRLKSNQRVAKCRRRQGCSDQNKQSELNHPGGESGLPQDKSEASTGAQQDDNEEGHISGDETKQDKPGTSDDEPELPQEVREAMAIALPCVGEKKTWTISPGFYRHLAEAYPGIDLCSELRKAKAWLIANSKQLKTYRGMERFIRSWIDRATNIRARTQSRTRTRKSIDEALEILRNKKEAR